LFHEDGQTDMTTLISAFRDFAKAPKKLKMLFCPTLYNFQNSIVFWKVLRLSRGAAPNDKINLNYI